MTVSDAVLAEHEARRLGVVAAVREAEAAERHREARLRRARTSRESRALEARFRVERRAEAQRIQDLNQERIDYLMLSFEPWRVAELPATKSRARRMPGETVQDLTFHRTMYDKLEGRRRRRLAPIPETDHLQATRKDLVAQLDAVVAEEDTLRRPSSSASSSASAATARLRTPRPIERPRQVPRLSLLLLGEKKGDVA